MRQAGTVLFQAGTGQAPDEAPDDFFADLPYISTTSSLGTVGTVVI